MIMHYLATLWLGLGVASAYWDSTSSETPVLLALEDKRGLRVWDDKGSTGRYQIIVYEPYQPANKWFLLGQRAQANYKDLTDAIHSFKILENVTSSADIFARPTRFSFIWDSRGGSSYDGSSIWRPICPSGYVALGDFFYRGDRLSEPPKDLYSKVRCVKESFTELCAGWKPKIWDNARSFDDKSASVWEGEPSQETSFISSFLYANDEHNIRPNIAPRCLRRSFVLIQN